MQGANRIVKRSCKLCTSENRDEIEEQLLNGHITPKEVDKMMGWRANTTDRHFRNHMG